MSSAAKDYFKKADQAAKKQNWEYAIELCLQGLIIKPAESEYRRKLHKWEAIAIEEKGGNPAGGLSTKLKVGGILTKVKKLTVQKKWDEAVIEQERAVRLAPHDVKLLFALGQLLENLIEETPEVAEAAIGTYQEIHDLDKGHVEAYRQLGKLFALQDDPETAIECWEKLKQYKPDDKEAGKAVRDLSAATMVKKAEDRKAESGDDSFKSMLKSEEESEELEKKSKIIRTDADRREAIKFKKEDLRADPKNSRLWRELGALYQDLKDWQRAELSFKKALEVNPHDLFVQEKLGNLRETRFQNEIEQLEEKLEASRSNGADGVEALASEVAAKQAEFASFKVEEYARRVKAHPTDNELKMRYGEVLMNSDRHDEAIGEFQKAVKDPKFRVQCHFFIGQCFGAKNLYDLSYKQYEEALKGVSDPDSSLSKEIKYSLGVVSENKGDKERALEWYQDLMSIDIGFRDVSARVSSLMS